MIRVAFILQPSQSWMGGFNYFVNLFNALNKLEEKNIEPILFLGTKSDPNFYEAVKDCIKIERVSFLNRWSISWVLWKLTVRIFKNDYFLKLMIKPFDIDIISHSNIIKVPGVQTINWIPDFQHLYLPEMFTKNELNERNKLYRKFAVFSNKIILSSHSAKSDFNKFMPKFSNKVRVLQFVAQPLVKEVTPEEEVQVINKFKIDENFFYLPNQFWKHKNHITVFKAFKLLKDKGCNFQLVCSGYKEDYRNKDHYTHLKKYISENNLNVKLLGLINPVDVVVLIKRSIAVINPSLFEGWSTTVEECKSLNKRMILSDIPVHREQNHLHSIYFDPNSHEDLSVKILNAFALKDSFVDATDDLIERTQSFAKRFQEIIHDCKA